MNLFLQTCSTPQNIQIKISVLPKILSQIAMFLPEGTAKVRIQLTISLMQWK